MRGNQIFCNEISSAQLEKHSAYCWFSSALPYLIYRSKCMWSFGYTKRGLYISLRNVNLRNTSQRHAVSTFQILCLFLLGVHVMLFGQEKANAICIKLVFWQTSNLFLSYLQDYGINAINQNARLREIYILFHIIILFCNFVLQSYWFETSGVFVVCCLLKTLLRIFRD